MLREVSAYFKYILFKISNEICWWKDKETKHLSSYENFSKFSKTSLIRNQDTKVGDISVYNDIPIFKLWKLRN